ncbi:MAG: VOC family protein [Desulfopila sp.]
MVRRGNPSRLDHLVVAAESLEQGVAFLDEELGVTLPFGGVHLGMGTHNHLARLGEGCFLEIIAPNPLGKTPSHPRWFGLDLPQIRAALKRRPRLMAWVVNCDDICQTLGGAGYGLGTPTPVSRGTLNWLFSLPADGRLPAGGALPYLIQWQTDVHPATGMAELGLSFRSLTVRHPEPEWLTEMLASIGAEGLVTVRRCTPESEIGLEAVLDTPIGERVLD